MLEATRGEGSGGLGRGLADGFVGLPDVEEVGVAGSGDGELALGSSAAEGGADVFFGVGQLGQRDFQSGTGIELCDVAEQLRDDEFVLPITALGHFGLEDGGKPH